MPLLNGWRKRAPSRRIMKGGERRKKIISKDFVSYIAIANKTFFKVRL